MRLVDGKWVYDTSDEDVQPKKSDLSAHDREVVLRREEYAPGRFRPCSEATYNLRKFVLENQGKLTHAEMAAQLGTTMGVVSTKIDWLRKKGFIPPADKARQSARAIAHGKACGWMGRVNVGTLTGHYASGGGFAKPPNKPKPLNVAGHPEPKSDILAVKRGCRFPYDYRKDEPHIMVVCGHKVVKGKPYCETHVRFVRDGHL
jgi:hypothetical protein